MTIGPQTKFFIYKVPNFDCLNQTLTHNEIALLENSARALEAIFAGITLQQEQAGIILFVQVQGRQQFSGVCKVTSSELTTEFRDDWSLYWQGSFKAAVKVEWLIPFCEMPFSKVSHLIASVFAKAQSALDDKDPLYQVDYFATR